MVASRQPANATAKKFIRGRLAWCATSDGSASQGVATAHLARFSVTG